MLNSAAARSAEIEETGTEAVLQGLAASGGIVEGRCRVVSDVNQLPKVEERTILVFSTSAPQIATIIPLLSQRLIE